MNRLSRPSLGMLAAGLAALLALWIAADTVVWIVRSYSALPFWDQWEVVLGYRQILNHSFRFSDLIAQHNEHRIVFPRLVFFTDWLAFKGSNILDLTVVYLLQLAHAALLIRLAGPLRRPLALAAAAVAASLLLSIGQWENLTWGFQVQFSAVFLLATGAFMLLTAAAGARESRRRAGLFAACLACLFVAEFCMANGMVATGVAVPLSLVLGAPLWMTAGLAGLLAVTGAVYFHNYHQVPDHSTLAYAVGHLGDFIAYVAAYLGNISGSFAGRPPGALFASLIRPFPILLGFAGLALAAAALVRAVLRRFDDPAETVLLAVIAFAVASAALTSLGRLSFGLLQAYSSRYHTPGGVFWAAQILLWTRAAGAWKPPGKAAVATGLLGLALLLTWVQLRTPPDLMRRANGMRWAEDAILSQVDDGKALTAVYPDPLKIEQLIPLLRQHGVSIFAAPQARWFGRPLSAIAKAASAGACIGAFDAAMVPAENPGDGARVAGWAWDQRDHRLPRRVLLTNAHFKIVGFASTGGLRPDVLKVSRTVRTAVSGWNGFAHVDGGLLHAFLILPDGAACEVGSMPASPAAARLSLVGPKKIGQAIPAAIMSDPSWTVGGAGPSAGTPLAGAKAMASWSGADSRMGQVTFGPFQTGAPDIAVGLVTGPASTSQAIIIRDASDQTILATLKPDIHPVWGWVRLRLPEGAAGKPILLQGVDQGAGWGQWMGITEPHLVAPPTPAPPP